MRRSWIPIGMETESPGERGFKGTMKNGTDASGKPYVIKGMYIDANSLASTCCFGLFGSLLGDVDGLVLTHSAININGAISEKFYVGTICGSVGTSKTTVAGLGNVTHCTAEQTSINVEGFAPQSADDVPSIGGLIGIININTSDIICSNLAKTPTMRVMGPAYIGGIAGDCDKSLKDCHAVVTMNVTNTTSLKCMAGGVLGISRGYGRTLPNVSQIACTSTGEINGTGNNITMGGILANGNYTEYMESCATSVALSGGDIMGGLCGHLENIISVESHGNFCSSFVDAKKATYAGGLFGKVDFDLRRYDGYYNLTPIGYQVFTTFAGTMTKPESADSYCGLILGYTKKTGSSLTPRLGYYYYDGKMCNMQLTGCGWDSYVDQTVGTLDIIKPDDGNYTYYQTAWAPDGYMKMEGLSAFYTENMRVAGAPFNITNDNVYYFNAYDVTIDFSLEKFVNQKTGEEIATFSVPTPPACVQVNEKTVKLLDPGEVVVVINCYGSQRKVHLDITYGKPWDATTSGNYAGARFLGGDGTAKTPYVIHNGEDLTRAAIGSSYNKEGIHYILTNDIFLNTHLLGDNEEPREDATPWNSRSWKGVLHGNGKTIYGLYVNKTDCEKGSGHGLFNNVSGTVSDLAVVDAYVSADGTNDSIAAGIICGRLEKHGVIERCLAHGRALANGFTGGICGYAAPDSTVISDCFAAVHVGWPAHGDRYKGAGMVYATPAELKRCIGIGKVESLTNYYGLTSNSEKATDCHFDCQMLAYEDHGTGSSLTQEMTSGKLLSGNSQWTARENAYPMLSQFVHTPYGEILSMPIAFYTDDNKTDRAGNITEIFNFPTERVRWWAHYGSQYLDVINECGAAAPNGRTGDVTEYLCVEPTNAASDCTRPLRVTAVNVRTDKAGIKFKDAEAEKACLAAFDTNTADGMVTLREAVEATSSQFKTFNENAGQVKSFTEMRYFAGVTKLEKGMLSGLSQLEEVVLPNTLTAVGTEALSGCSSLQEIELPYRFSTTDEGAFYGSAIKNILVNEKNANCKSIDGALYQKAADDEKVMLMAYPPGRGEESATLSCRLTKILPNAIYKVPGLRNVYIDNCLPGGEMAELEDNGLVHENARDRLHVYVNDGSFNSKLFLDYYNDDTWGEDYYDEGHLDIYYPLTVTSAGWATLYIDFPTQLPEGLNAYIAEKKDSVNNVLTLQNIGRIIPRSTPVVIKAETAGLYPLYKYEGTVPTIEKYKNWFIGTFIGQDDKFGVPVNQETSESGSILTLGRNSAGTIGFYKYNGEVIPPYRAYLTCNIVKDGPLQAAPYMSFIIVDDVLGIDDISNSTAPADNAYYTLDGRKLQGKPSHPGIYIVNGKKIIIR